VLLTDLGIDPRNLLPTLEGRSHLWRDRLAGKRVLLVLDDATGPDQVRPLLPGSPDCLTLITSRRRLIALDDAEPLSLPRARRTATDSEGRAAVAETVRLCGYLPLAIVLLAGRLHHKPRWTIARFAADVATAQDRLAEFHDGRTLAVHTAFQLSYQDLPRDQQRLFRRIGLHLGPDIDAYAAAALDHALVPATRRRLEALYADHLLEEIAPCRYRPHDLLREYARDRATGHDTADDRAQAVERLLGYYQHTVQTADRILRRSPDPGTLAGPTSPDAPVLSDRDAALAWVRTERTSLFACVHYAVTHEQHACAVRLAEALNAFLRQEGPWSQLISLNLTAISASAHLNDRTAQATALHNTGWGQGAAGDYRQAAESQEAALASFRDLADRHGQARTLYELCRIRSATSNCSAAAALHEQALALFRDLADRTGEATALGALGGVRRLTGNYEQATRCHEQALALFQEVGDAQGEAETLNNMGALLAESTGPQAALVPYRHALELACQVRSPLDEARAREGVAWCLADAGDRTAALAELRKAVGIYQRIGAPEAMDAAEYLAGLEAEESGGASALGIRPIPEPDHQGAESGNVQRCRQSRYSPPRPAGFRYLPRGDRKGVRRIGAWQRGRVPTGRRLRRRSGCCTRRGCAAM
jgi:tetratricopeptide (TPR) repeat protein